MISLAEKPYAIPGIRYFGPARVIEKNDAEGLVRVRIDRFEDDDKVIISWARPAIPYSHKLRFGETVLVAGEHINDFYIIGVLGPIQPEKDSENCLIMKCGAQAKVTGQPDTEKLQVLSQQGELVFEYDATTGKSRVDVPAGDLEISTRKGNINFSSAQGIRFSSIDPIEMHSQQSVTIAASEKPGETSSVFNLEPQKIDMNSPELGFKADKGIMQIEETRFTGKKMSAAIENVNCIMERLDSAAGTVIEKMKNVYKTVEGLTQMRTGRMRTLVDETYQFKSKKAFLKTEEDFKVKGEKIYLG